MKLIIYLGLLSCFLYGITSKPMDNTPARRSLGEGGDIQLIYPNPWDSVELHMKNHPFYTIKDEDVLMDLLKRMKIEDTREFLRLSFLTREAHEKKHRDGGHMEIGPAPSLNIASTISAKLGHGRRPGIDPATLDEIVLLNVKNEHALRAERYKKILRNSAIKDSGSSKKICLLGLLAAGASVAAVSELIYILNYD